MSSLIPLPHRRKHRHPAELTVLIIGRLRTAGPGTVCGISKALRLGKDSTNAHLEALVKRGVCVADFSERGALRYSLTEAWRCNPSCNRLA